MKGFLTFNGAIIVQGMPICSDRPIADALRAAAAFKIDVQPEAWPDYLTWKGQK